MRSFLGWLVLVVVLAAIAFLGAPVVARPLVADAVRSLSPFGDSPLQVDVDVDSLGLLGGKVKRIHVSGSDLASERLDADQLDITVFDVDILDRSFDRINGNLVNAILRRADGTEIPAVRVFLTGASGSVQMQAVLDRDPALAIIRDGLRAAGLSTEGVTLVENGVRVSILGQPTDVSLSAVDGAVELSSSLAPFGPIKVFAPEAGDPWRVTGVVAGRTSLDVYITVDAGGLFSSS